MKPIPFQWLKVTAWLVFAEMITMVLWLWLIIFQGYEDAVLGLAFTFLAVMAYPNLSAGGWGFLKGWNLCRNRPTFLVALGLNLLFAISFAVMAFDDKIFDKLYALGMVIPGLLLVRAYIDTVTKPQCEV